MPWCHARRHIDYYWCCDMIGKIITKWHNLLLWHHGIFSQKLDINQYHLATDRMYNIVNPIETCEMWHSLSDLGANTTRCEVSYPHTRTWPCQHVTCHAGPAVHMVEKKRVTYFRRGKYWGEKRKGFWYEKWKEFTIQLRAKAQGVEGREELPPNPTLHRLLVFLYSCSGQLEVLNVLIQ